MKHPFYTNKNAIAQQLQYLQMQRTNSGHRVPALGEDNLSRLRLAKTYLEKAMNELSKIEIG
jgi:hypothetical protein